MDWKVAQEVWDEFLWFMDRVMQWLQYVFGIKDKWPPEDYPDFKEPTTQA